MDVIDCAAAAGIELSGDILPVEIGQCPLGPFDGRGYAAWTGIVTGQSQAPMIGVIDDTGGGFSGG